MTIAIVISVYNDAVGLRRCVESLRGQCLDGDELIVVDDGSCDEDVEVNRRSVAVFGVRGVYLTLPHVGRAAARNAGFRAARAAVVLFLGSDCFPARSLVARHRAVHCRQPEETVGCLGMVTWDPTLPPSPFMVWLEHGGSQNAYGELAGSTAPDPRRFCYAANLSIKRSMLGYVGGFDARHFSHYGWEDTDLGIRLADVGWTLRYEPTALVWHRHTYTVRSFRERQRAAGRSLMELLRLHPTVVEAPAALRPAYRVLRRVVYPTVVRRAAIALAERAEHRWLLSGLYARVTGWAFTDGVQDAAAPS